MLDLKIFMKDVHNTAKTLGWYDGYIKTDLEIHMCIMSEICEAAEQVKLGKPSKYVENGKPEGEVVELADAILYILDYCEYKNYPLIEALIEKNNYNKTRSKRHGKVK